MISPLWCTRDHSVLWTSHVSPRPSVVQVVAPDTVDPSAYVIAARVVGQHLEVWRRDQVVVPVDDLQVPEVGSSPETFPCEVAAAHLCRRVGAGRRRPGVNDLAAELHHARVVPQVGEQR